MSLKQKLSKIIRVDHAGEFGAQVIYKGQIAALKLKKDEQSLELVKHMKEQEDEHFEYFNAAIKSEKVRPTIMQPIWGAAGFGLGFVTAMMGKKSAMACTVAVEEVIDEHYQAQLKELEEEKLKNTNQDEINKINALQEKIEKFRQEELEHRDIGIDHDAQDLKFYQPLTSLIKMASKTAIFTSTKI
jgi:3-demethoxyubiquinol 3-hydroxylase